jgi:D-xylose reductase
LIKNIGVSNYNAALIRDLLAYCKVRPSVLQIEHHPYLTQSALVDYCQREGIAVTAYSSFGPQSFIELDNPRVKENPLLLEHPTILEIATEMQRTPAQVLLRWATQRNIAVIPKSNNQQRLEQNVHCTDFELTQEQIKKISDLNIELRFNDTLDWNVPVVIF